MVFGAILGAVGAGLGLLGQSSQASAQNRAINAQYEYDKDYADYSWRSTLQAYDFRLQENQTARFNQETNLNYLEQSQIRAYTDQLAIRDYEYQNQMRQYQQSERIYGMQLKFNNQAAEVARESENRRFQEILTGMAFDQQDLFVKMLQEEGQVQALGVSGRSAGKVLSSAIASYGRNQAILAESLVSAKKESRIARKQIEMEKYGADLNAEARRMLAPIKAPAPSAPLSMPRAVILDPPRPLRPPDPIKGAAAQGPSPFSIAANAFTSFAEIGSAANWW